MDVLDFENGPVHCQIWVYLDEQNVRMSSEHSIEHYRIWSVSIHVTKPCRPTFKLDRSIVKFGDIWMNFF